MIGQDLWKKAKRIIPGGNQLLSKRCERFLPEMWPAYYAKAKGCEVWDLDGNRYYDFAQMGVGSCVLGYADEDVNNAVIRAIENGSMCSLNSYEEVELAEHLIDKHPWSEMARFARTGGEACAIAIRIARAASERSKVAFCGYHGWHDWYLSANLEKSGNLDNLLLPGLEPRGIPSELMNTALPFRYNKIESLEALVDRYPKEIGVIIMEPRREHGPKPGFLERVREIANEISAVLIFDEVTSGFRMNLGGIHMELKIEPDLAIFGKGLGNGFPIAAIVGRQSIMEAAQSTFISSTMWTERVGFVAALATLKKMEEKNVPELLIKYGEMINDGWRRLSHKHKLNIHIDGIPPLTHISFEYGETLLAQTLYAQEMLSKGYLLGSAIYASYAYSIEVIDRFISDSDDAFGLIKEAINSGDIEKHLKCSVIQSGFERLT